MAWRPHGRAQVDAGSPRAFGICDRCGFLYNLNQLKFQYDWRGKTLSNTQLRVCNPCYDKPADFLKPIRLPPDPPPVNQPRVENYTVAETSLLWDEPNENWDLNGIEFMP